MRDEHFELERQEREEQDLLAPPFTLEEPSFLVLESGRIRFLYQLEVGGEAIASELLRELRIMPRASYIVAVFNPESKWRFREGSDAEGSPREPSIYDDALMARFGKRRFAPLEPAFLEHEGAELVLIGGGSQRPEVVSAVTR